ncbi:sugar transferase [Paraburkholderia saeva]|uniref:sugar transferase n=1 Tax=Paraburkholderia saeva TaxID=2777537 RepID=UPI001D5633B6|nr:sugar transferase [Paraburkholderia saeva]CAG4900572.1 hypothetical protein R52603_02757 [Paraburkholderia saeva]
MFAAAGIFALFLFICLACATLSFVIVFRKDVEAVIAAMRSERGYASAEEDTDSTPGMAGLSFIEPGMLSKEIFDRTVAALALVALLPLFALVAAGIKVTSPGPLLAGRRRLGLNGKVFTLYRFRTMHVARDSTAAGVFAQAKAHDSRITRIGALLKRTSLDTLPEFFNVLTGDMSIVGPRPETLAASEQFKEYIGGYRLRYRVKPGMTGWAQVSGINGAPETHEELQRQASLDLFYIQHHNLWLDLRIVSLALAQWAMPSRT